MITTFNPVARPDDQLFVALMSGEHAMHGFANRDLRAKLTSHLGGIPVYVGMRRWHPCTSAT